MDTGSGGERGRYSAIPAARRLLLPREEGRGVSVLVPGLSGPVADARACAGSEAACFGRNSGKGRFLARDLELLSVVHLLTTV